MSAGNSDGKGLPPSCLTKWRRWRASAVQPWGLALDCIPDTTQRNACTASEGIFSMAAESHTTTTSSQKARRSYSTTNWFCISRSGYARSIASHSCRRAMIGPKRACPERKRELVYETASSLRHFLPREEGLPGPAYRCGSHRQERSPWAAATLRRSPALQSESIQTQKPDCLFSTRSCKTPGFRHQLGTLQSVSTWTQRPAARSSILSPSRSAGTPTRLRGPHGRKRSTHVLKLKNNISCVSPAPIRHFTIT